MRPPPLPACHPPARAPTHLGEEQEAGLVAGQHVVHQHCCPCAVLAQPHLVGTLCTQAACDHHPLNQVRPLSKHCQRTQEPARDRGSGGARPARPGWEPHTHQQFPRRPCRMSEGRSVWNTDQEVPWSLKTEQLISCGRNHCRTRCWTLSPAGKPTDAGPGGKLSSTKFTLFCRDHGHNSGQSEPHPTPSIPSCLSPRGRGTESSPQPADGTAELREAHTTLCRRGGLQSARAQQAGDGPMGGMCAPGDSAGPSLEAAGVGVGRQRP